MPRAPVAGKEIRRRSRNGCWNCKARKVKCGEEKPRCSNCTRLDEDCDYKIRLSWGGRPLKKKMMQEQGGHIDDPSQNIPGAGQFSINTYQPTQSRPARSHHHYHSSSLTSPITPTTIHSSGGIRKTPAKPAPKAGMAVFQNVFSVCDATPPMSLPSSTTSSPHFYAGLQYPQQQSQQPQAYYPGVWAAEREHQSPLTPSTLDGDVYYTIKEDGYAPYANGQYGSHSPTPSLTALTMTSPTASSLPQSPNVNLADPSSFPQHTTLGSVPPKRIKTSTSPELQYNMVIPTSSMASMVVPSSAGPLTSSIDYLNAPLTPPSHASTEPHIHHAYHSNDNSRRVSVENLLSTPMNQFQNFSNFNDRFAQVEVYSPQTQTVIHNPAMTQYRVENIGTMGRRFEEESVEDMHRFDNGVEKRGYPDNIYSPVSNMGPPVSQTMYTSIPRDLHPLPPQIMDNSENAMYFQHFLNHTSSMLVPLDCAGNPFKSILPKMAMQDNGLLNLLLAYSASHQARLLNKQEPTELVSNFLGQAVSSLNKSLNDEVKQKSDSTLATAIMLCSYEIISPNSFARGITWQTHLAAVRKIIMARGGVQGITSNDEVPYFLLRWFAYLDVFGSVGGKSNQRPLFNGNYWIITDDDGTSELTIDCFFGFTNRYISLLAQISELVHACDTQKDEYVTHIRSYGYTSAASDWAPSEQVQQEGIRLREQLEESRRNGTVSCDHNNISSSSLRVQEVERQDLLGTNDAFHWAAQVLLLKRVFNYQIDHQLVQDAVRRIMTALRRVREHGNTENCLLFPLFIAGCESVDGMDRDYTLRRMLRLETNGLSKLNRGRILMQTAWQTSSPWELLHNGEFLG